MSVFKVCTWWSVQCQDILDNYDSASLLTCRFNLDSNEKDYIIVGSHAGHLSIFYPTSELSEEGYFKGYKPTNLLLETNLKAPVIGLSAGRFSGSPKNENNNQLAVLFPFSLSIYNFSTVHGVAEHGSHFSLQTVIEHQFSRTTFSICKGPFGRVKGREFLCILHMDSTLTFFEHDGISYECTLPGYNTLPSVLAYIPRTDSFVRINSCWELESFSYQDISQSAVNKSELTPQWSICVGECAVDICCAQITNTKTTILILGEHNLINISDDGKVEYVIRLDYSPKCFCSFVIGWYWEPNTRLITAVVSESSSLLIYDGAKLIWAAQLEDVPVAIQKSNLENLPGGIVTLGANGLLHIGYLGSEPYTLKVPPLNLKDMSFEKSQKELIELEKSIKQSIDLTDVETINATARKDFELDFMISFAAASMDDHQGKQANQPLYPATIKFKTRINLNQIQIILNMADGIKCSQSIFTFDNVVENAIEVVEVHFFLEDRLPISSAQVTAIASFINKQGTPRIVSKSGILPLAMFYKSVPPQKDGSIKITLTINSGDQQKSQIHKLSSVYPEFCENNDMQAIGLCLHYDTEKIVTVVAAKNTNRFRIQSDYLEAIPLVLEAMIDYVRISEQFDINMKKDKNVPRPKQQQQQQNKSLKNLIAAPSIPIEDIMQRVENHYEIQKEIKTQTALMDALWNQFKLFQRSLQSKKDEDAIDGIMMLIEKNYDDLVSEGDKLVNYRKEEINKRSSLSCAIALTKSIMSCLNLDNQLLEPLLSALYVPVEEWTETIWEEAIAPAFDMLNLYGPLSRDGGGGVGRDKNIPLDDNHSTTAAYHFEFDRFKRHMTSLLDRVCRLATDLKQRQQLLPAAKAVAVAAPSSTSKNKSQIQTQIETEQAECSPMEDAPPTKENVEEKLFAETKSTE